MGDDSGLHQFAIELQQDVINRASLETQEEFLGDAFARIMVECLADAGELNDGEICYHKARGIEVSGYHLNDDSDELDLFLCIYSQKVPPVSVTRTEMDAHIRRLENFFARCREGYYRDLEEASPVYDMASRLYEAREKVTKVRYFIFTDGLVKFQVAVVPDNEGICQSVHVWDIERLFRCVSSGQRREPIEVDFVAEFGEPVPCLIVPNGHADYKAYLAIIRGDILHGLYDRYGPRLLELNIRSFLQARGNINKGIRDTILKQPERFLAYNNGISVVASEIKVKELSRGGKGIVWVRDFQIVNGGQTTASIYHAAKKDKADPASVYVQAKLSIVAPERVDEMVPLISRFANSQNKINDADFSANDPYHVELEKLSRSVWAPAVDGTQRQTKWFYERARGQYLDAKGRETTPARKREFSAIHPTSQKFTKTDLAKFENSWDQLPHKVSFGAQKNFREFTLRLAQRKNFTVDQSYFERLVAKAILFRSAEKIVSAEQFGGYRANIVTYTIAYLSYKTAQRIDLAEIWRKQVIATALEKAIRVASRKIYKVIVEPPGGKNITEWCKGENCWQKVRNLEISLPSDMNSILLPINRLLSGAASGSDELSKDDQANVSRVMSVPAEVWFELSRWAKETNNLEPRQRSIAYTLGRLVSQGKAASRKQAWTGVRILDEAGDLGFRPTSCP